MSHDLALPQFLSKTPVGVEIREQVKAALQELFGKSIKWKRIKNDIFDGSDLPWAEESFNNFTKNIHHTPPEGDNTYYMALLYWICVFGCNLNSEKSNSIADSLCKNVLGKAYRDVFAEAESDYDLKDDLQDLSQPALRWNLMRVASEAFDETLLSFSLDDYSQLPTKIGSLGIYLEIFGEPREIADGVACGFERVTIQHDIKNDVFAEVSYNSLHLNPKDTSSQLSVVMKGVRHSNFWEVTASPAINGKIEIHESPIMSIRPRNDQFEFSCYMSVRTRDLKILRKSEISADFNRNAVITSLFARKLDKKSTISGVLEISRHVYKICAGK